MIYVGGLKHVLFSPWTLGRWYTLTISIFFNRHQLEDLEEILKSLRLQKALLFRFYIRMLTIYLNWLPPVVVRRQGFPIVFQKKSRVHVTLSPSTVDLEFYKIKPKQLTPGNEPENHPFRFWEIMINNQFEWKGHLNSHSPSPKKSSRNPEELPDLGGGFKYFLCSPLFGEDEPILTSIFFRWVETTKQLIAITLPNDIER